MLYGREVERARIEALLDGARTSHSGVLVIRGEAGIGKTALLDEVRERGGDLPVLRCRGVESESQLPFAGLDQLLRPVLRHVGKLPRPQAGALRGALGLGAGGGDRFLVSLAVLSVLAEAAGDGPLVCLVDDAHWLDEASADALVFAARRLEAEGVVMLFAARSGEALEFASPGLPELRLGGLDADAARALLNPRAGAALSPAALAWLVEHTGGNPLALLELPSSVSAVQLVSGDPLLAPLPVGERVERSFLARVRTLPEQTQTLLLVAAAQGSGELSVVLDAATRLGVEAEALDAAEHAGLVHVPEQRLEFRHPLVRSAVYHGAPLSRRHAAHGALAACLSGDADTDRRAWHLAAASVAPAPTVAGKLELTAQRARARGGFAAASLAYERAAALTGERDGQVRRLTAAAENAWFAGRGERARLLLERALSLATDPDARNEVDRSPGMIEMTGDVPATGVGLLVAAAAALAPRDGERAIQLLTLAVVAAIYAGDDEAATAVAGVARSISVAEPPWLPTLTQLLIGLAAHRNGDFTQACQTLRGVLGLEAELAHGPLTEVPVTLLFAGRASVFLGDDHAVYRIHHQLAARARSTGALGPLAVLLPRVAYADLSAGRWASATAHAEEGLRLARDIDDLDLVAEHLAMLALIAAHGGDEQQCRARAAEAGELATTHQFVLAADLSRWALALLELGRGRGEDAWRRAREIHTVEAVLWGGMDRIETAVRAAALDTAQDWLDTFHSWAEATAQPWAGAVSLHCQALLTQDEGDAAELFRAALTLHDAAERPFHRARTELAFGEFLRRSRRRIDAREHLYAAHDRFEALGARRWAERARAELRASGQTARSRADAGAPSRLTAQEHQIAALVGQGLSNRDAAAYLFLSPRTVAFHLRNIFSKLDISSRVELAHLDLRPTSEPGASAPNPAM